MARNPFEHLSVLIVDDNGHMRQIIETALRAWGIGNIHMAADGAEGLNVLRTIAIDFVLTDLNMGVLDGFDFVRMVRTTDDSPNPYVPIIVISSSTDLQTVTQARDAGMTEFLAKPVTPRTLYDRLVSIIQRPRPFIRSKKYFGRLFTIQTMRPMTTVSTTGRPGARTTATARKATKPAASCRRSAWPRCSTGAGNRRRPGGGDGRTSAWASSIPTRSSILPTFSRPRSAAT